MQRFRPRLWAGCALSAWLAFSQVYFPLVYAYDVNDAQDANDFGAALLSGASALPSVNSGVPTGDTGPGTLNVRDYVPGANESQAWETSTYYENPAALKDAVREAHRDVRQAGCRTTTFVAEKYDHPVMTVEARRLIAVHDRDPITGAFLYDNVGAPLSTMVVAEQVPFAGDPLPFTLRPFGSDEEHLHVISYPSLTADGFAYLFKYDRLQAPNDGSFIPSSPRISAGGFSIASPGTVYNEWTMTGTISAAGHGMLTFWVNLHRVETVYAEPAAVCPADPPGCVVSGIEVCAVSGFDLSSIYTSKDHQTQGYDIIMGGDANFRSSRPVVADVTDTVSQSARAVSQGINPVSSEVSGGGCSEDRVYKGPVTEGLYRVSQTCFSEFMGCLGTDCHNPSAQHNGGFGQAAAGLAAFDQIQHDMTCLETGNPPQNPYDACDLRIFRGTHQTCKIPIGSGVGLAPDCCDEGANAAAGIDLIAYFKLVYFTQKLARLNVVKQAFVGFPGAAGWQTAYNATVAPIKGAVQATITGFENAVSGFFQELGFNTGGSSGINLNIFSVIQQAMMAAFKDLLVQLFGQTFADTVIVTTVSSTGETTLAFAGPIMWIIAIWYIYQILKIIGSIVFKCTEEELRLGISVAAEECFYAGTYCQNDVLGICVEKRKSYCCYKSFLSRLFMEEFRVRQAIGGGVGDEADPYCEGLTIAELQSADWSRVDLTPYLRRMEEAGIMPSSAY